MADLSELINVLEQQNTWEREHKLTAFKPYDYQHEFYCAHGYDTDKFGPALPAGGKSNWKMQLC